jgi:molecular chaperone DnaJ
VSVSRAALGGKLDVPTLGGGKAVIDVPSGTAHGRYLRLRGKGLKSLKRSGHGDLLVRIAVVTPPKLSDKGRKLLQEFEQLADSRTPGPRRPAEDTIR